MLTPAYEEDVLYALKADVAAEELGLPPKKVGRPLGLAEGV